MKISINGTVYNTKHIFSISEIKEGIKVFSFEIEFRHYRYPYSISVEIPIKKGYEKNHTHMEEMTYRNKLKEINRNRLEEIRQNIINIWSNNLPVVNFDTRKS